MARGNSAYISPAQRRRIANSPAVQAQVKAAAARGLAAFRGSVKKVSGDAARHSELRPTRAPRTGVKGTAVVAYPGARGTRNPNAPVPILFGTARQAADPAMQVARRAVENSLMVVQAEPGFAPIEDVLIAYLERVLDLPGDTVLDDAADEGFVVNRVGGEDDGITDYPRVEVTGYGPNRAAEQRIGEAIRQHLLVLGGQLVEYGSGAGTPGDLARHTGHEVVVDFCATDTPPDSVAYDNPDRKRSVGYYRAGLRRPYR